MRLGKMIAPLSDDDKTVLLRISRDALEAAVYETPFPDLVLDALPARVREPGASFVTLSNAGRLRGCIGSVTIKRALAVDVQIHAQSAALYDYRFPPVVVEELPQIRIEVSVLNAPRALQYNDSHELLCKLRPDIDGVILVHGTHRSTFLPQVWERFKCPEEFMDSLCEKALLPRSAWRQLPLEIFTYQVESFREPDEPRT
jgi:AmmeMemoRadiSam system protein A